MFLDSVGGVAYLAKPTAAKRTAYLRAIGLVQGFQALDLLDRDAVKSGWPSVGMRTEARRFVWGDPSAAYSDARRSVHWHSLDSPFAFGRRNPGDIALLTCHCHSRLRSNLRYVYA